MSEMRTPGADSTAAEVVPPYRTGGVGKFVSDTVSVFEINFLPVVKHWYLMLLMALGFPIPWFYVTRSIAPDDPDILRRLLAGTIVFGVTFSIGMLVGQNVVAQRFMGNLRLLITMPVSKGAYVLGSLAYSSISGTITVVALLGFGLAAGVDIDVAWGLVPSLILSVLTMAGLTLFVVSFAPSLQAGEPDHQPAVPRAGRHISGLLHDGAGAVPAQAARLRLASPVRCRRYRQIPLRAWGRLDGAGGTGRIRGRDDVAGPVAAALEGRVDTDRRRRASWPGQPAGAAVQHGNRTRPARGGASPRRPKPTAARLSVRPAVDGDLGPLTAALGPDVPGAQVTGGWRRVASGIVTCLWPSWTDRLLGPSAWEDTAFKGRARCACSRSTLERLSAAGAWERLW